jgi:hypothetical protein
MKIQSLSIRNFKGAKQVDIHAPDGVVEVAGKNGAGKSSVLDAIVAALAGARDIDPTPLTQGATKGEITLDLGDLICIRRFNEKNQGSGGTLTVQHSSGEKWKQRDLNAIFGDFTFDPLKFSRMAAAEQVTTLQRLAGEDFCKRLDAIDGATDIHAKERTEVNRDLKKMGTVPDPEQVEPVDTRQLMEQLQQAQDHNAAQQRRVDQIKDHEARQDAAFQKVEQLRNDLQIAEHQLAQIRDEQTPAPEAPIDVAPIQAQLAQAGETNAKAEAFQQAQAKRETWKALNARSLKLDRKVEDLREQRRQLARNCQLPVEGLAWTADGIALNGIAFDQISSSEQLRLSARIGMALSPTLQVMLIHDGALLDDDSFQELVAFAGEHGYQLWVETVGVKGHSDERLVIEDGQLDTGRGF